MSMIHKGFISYSHADVDICRALYNALGPLQGRIRFWYDRHQQPGDDWKPTLAYHLKNAQVAIFISSPEAFKPDGYIASSELPYAEALWRAKRLLVVTATARPVHLGDLFLNRTELCPDKGRTLRSRYDKIQLDAWCADVARAIGARLSGGDMPALGTHPEAILEAVFNVEQLAENLISKALNCVDPVPPDVEVVLVSLAQGALASLRSPIADIRFDVEAIYETVQRELKDSRGGEARDATARLAQGLSELLGSLDNSQYPYPPGFRSARERWLVRVDGPDFKRDSLLEQFQRVESEARFVGQAGVPEALAAARTTTAKVEVGRALLSGREVDGVGLRKIVGDIQEQTAGFADDLADGVIDGAPAALSDAASRFRAAGAQLRSGLGPHGRFSDAPELPELVVIESGSFEMGAAQNDRQAYADESPRHTEIIHSRFALGLHPVTNGQWRAFRASSGYQPGGKDLPPAFNNHPVVSVSRTDAIAYCEWASWKSGANYRLPTEAEWEFACRAGTSTPYWFGTRASLKNANVGRDGSGTTSVGSYSSNPFGLYDIHGNVWEWCADLWCDDYDTPRTGRREGDMRQRYVFRGGSWNSAPKHARSSNRYGELPDVAADDLGFRVARDLV